MSKLIKTPRPLIPPLLSTWALPTSPAGIGLHGEPIMEGETSPPHQPPDFLLKLNFLLPGEAAWNPPPLCSCRSGKQGTHLPGVGGDVCFPCCSCSFPGGPQLGKQILGNLQGSSGASFSAITKQQREHCFQKLQAKRNRARVAGTVSQSELFHTPSAAF